MFAKEKTAQTRTRVHVRCVGSSLIGPSSSSRTDIPPHSPYCFLLSSLSLFISVTVYILIPCLGQTEMGLRDGCV